LPKFLYLLDCSNNQLTVINYIPKYLRTLSCNNNQLTKLPKLCNKLNILNCNNNKLYILPKISLHTAINFINNPIYSIINSNNVDIINEKINILNRFKYIYFCIKYKNRFRYILYEKIRKPKIEKKYSPEILVDLLKNIDDTYDTYETEFNNLLNNW
jgi:Leucine-rich repeat (LRR) protein